jgi:acylphosphatase
VPKLIAKKFQLMGKVQGVGCRNQVQELVEKVGHLAGWVQNLPDGSVEVYLKGPPLRLEAAEKIMKYHMLPPVMVERLDVVVLSDDFSAAGFYIKRS